MINPTPRKYKKVNKKLIRNTYENKSNTLKFGTHGIQAIHKGFLTVDQIEAIRRTITGNLKRKAKVWIRAYPNYPRTAKPKEVRMGRGKGAVDHWLCFVKPGKILFEVTSKNPALVQEVLLFTLQKLPFLARVVTKHTVW
jgi:large subunit ribosomal protein L16